MSTKVQPTIAMAQSTSTAQRSRIVLEAEIFQDPDGGPDTLIVTTDELACEPVSPARLRAMVADTRSRLDAIELMAKVYEAEDTIRAIVVEHNALLEEWNTSTLEPRLRDNFVAAAMLTDEQMVFVVPEGQNPIARANALADLANSLEKQAALA